MARLPQPGGDEGAWGTILNEYLSQAHNTDGTLKTGAIGNTHLQPNSITPGKLNATTPTAGQVLSYDGTGFVWITNPAGVTDHGLLTGLADDDHPQYHTDVRGDARYYTQAQINTSLAGKANTSHTHAIADVTNLQTSLDAKAASAHTHAAVDIASGVLSTARLGTGTADGTTFLRGDGTWASLPGSSATWGSITGTLSDQTDLQSILNTKEGTIGVGTISQYYRGDKSWQTLDKTTVGLANVDNTSDANKPISTATQTALDGKAGTAHTHVVADLTDFTEATQDVLNSTLVAGTNVTLTYDDPANTLTISATPGAGVTDLSVSTTASDVTIISSTGNDATVTSATGSNAGILTATDKTKLDGIATGATANSSDATLLDRANHTGSQAISTVTGLQTALDAKPAISSGAGAPVSTPAKVGDIYIDTTGDDAYIAVGTSSSTDWEKTNDGTGGGGVTWGSITGTLSSQTDLQTILDGKAATSHTHAIADTTGLQAALDGKAAAAHTHSLAAVTDVTASAVELNILDGATLSTAELNYVDGVTSAIQTQIDGKASTSHNHDASYQPLDSDLTAIAALAPTNDDLIQRKAGVWTNRTPAQVKTDLALVKSDVGLANVDNTSDANKPISTATQAALDAKAAISHAHVIADTTGLQTALDGKVDENAAITGATKTMITYDAKGLVTAGTDATQDDIGDGTNFKQYSAADKTKLAGIEAAADVTDTANVSAAGAPIISSGAGAPSSTPAKVGDIYIDTTADDAYIAVGTASSTDWEKSNDGAGGGVADGDKGDITVSGSGATWTVDNDTVTYAKLQNVSASNLILGRITAGAGDAEELTAANVRTIINVADGATANLSDATLLARANHTGTQTLSTISDVTASAAELNILDGATLSTTELNYVDGVTSAIQGQLDAKAASSHNHDGSYQPLDTELTALAGLTSAADKLPYFSGAGTAATTDLTSTARTLLDDTSTSAMRTTLGLAIGTDVQAYNANLTTWAGKTAPSGTVVGTTDTQTLSNKTLASPIITGNTTADAVVSIGPTESSVSATTAGLRVTADSGSASDFGLTAYNNGYGAIILSGAGGTAASPANTTNANAGSIFFQARTGGTWSAKAEIFGKVNGDIDLTTTGAGVVKANGVEVTTLTGAQTLTNKTLTAPVLSGTVTGTYTLGGTPTFPASVVTTTGTQTLTNKTLTAPIISTISNTGTVTLPTSTDTLVGRATTDTLTNKTLTTPTITTLTVKDPTDTTKVAVFDVSSIATGTTRTYTLPNITGTLVTATQTTTLTNKRITSRVGTTTSSATPTINTDNVDMYGLTAQAVDITSFTTNLSGTPTDGQKLWIYIVGTAARTIAWGASFEASTVALPTTTVSTNRLDVGFVWNAATSKWRCVAVA